MVKTLCEVTQMGCEIEAGVVEQSKYLNDIMQVFE